VLLDENDQRHAVDSAWLHDVGYAPDLVSSGLHPLDGARYLRQRGDVDPQVVLLVAHHTGAVIEAEEWDLLDELREFGPPDADLFDVLTTADVVTGPDGSWLRAADRVSEILSRYERGTPVHRAVSRSAPDLIATVERVERRLSEAGGPDRRDHRPQGGRRSGGASERLMRRHVSDTTSEIESSRVRSSGTHANGPRPASPQARGRSCWCGG
jgi:hypothetical protein